MDFTGGDIVAKHLSSDTGSVSIRLGAYGGFTSGKGTGGDGKILADGITAESGGGNVWFEAIGSVMGYDADGHGAGSGSIETSGAIKAESLNGGNASVTATEGSADSSAAILSGGTGTIISEVITVKSNYTGKAEVSAVGTTQKGSISGRAEVNSGAGQSRSRRAPVR
jgi:hypothetical protein